MKNLQWKFEVKISDILNELRKRRIDIELVGDQEEFVKEFKFGDPRLLALKAMGEIRNQLKLQLEIFQCLYDMKAVQEFQEEVLQIIGEVAADVRNEIINRLIQRQALYKSLKFT